MVRLLYCSGIDYLRVNWRNISTSSSVSGCWTLMDGKLWLLRRILSAEGISCTTRQMSLTADGHVQQAAVFAAITAISLDLNRPADSCLQAARLGTTAEELSNFGLQDSGLRTYQ
jgi:hypothetical protein